MKLKEGVGVLLKEKDYDDFVKDCVQKGRDELDAGLGMSLTQAKESSRKLIERKAKELDSLNGKVAYV
ncbi:hypothetical protein [Histophilus somni]|uniref:Uncharacterized protein n=1 Tax=Histophilus somni TaxID=731 RepID=A0AAX2S3I3_HISSO|nr:hypothetical protein [Histophilus somni]TDF43997.1 hypothetical protein E1290_00205 [Histophilus somni]TEW30916.1 hypothetical protein E2R48_01785 [Histophilus somni]TFF03043.1 hypothetical protein E3U35_00190 [Histophilus somni]THA97068.1 hypothetical protein E6A58_01840 [Histophilus somni]TJY53920.1 hypothetical protein FAZ28_00190 [Histophilus somni]